MASTRSVIMLLVRRSLFLQTFLCRRGFVTSPALLHASPSDVALQSAFRHACLEEGMEHNNGVAEEAFLALISERGNVTFEDARAQLHSSSAFVVKDGVVRMSPQTQDERSKCEAMLFKVASKIPTTGVSGSQLQAILEDEMPFFKPSLVGALSLKDAIQSYPNVFIVESASGGKWTARPASEQGEKVSTGGSSSIVDYCRRKALSGCRDDFAPLIQAMQETGTSDNNLLRELLKNEALMKILEVKLSVKILPKRQPRAAYCFIDGDELTVSDVDNMWRQLNLSEQSTRILARRPTSAKHDSGDIVPPEEMPTSALIERKAKEITLNRSVILHDVVYMCSSRQFTMYAMHVAVLNAFPDADVYVCCPKRVQIISEKQYVPL